MAYNQALGDHTRELVAGVDNLAEPQMFGLAFLINGNMAVAASGHGDLLVRADPTDADEWGYGREWRLPVRYTAAFRTHAIPR